MILPRSQAPLRWLFLDLNSYFASVEQQLQPHLRGRPVVVAPVDTDTTSAIAASYEAKAFGIRTGTPIWEAKRKCRDLLITPARHDRYVAFHDRIVAEVNRHIPVTKVWSIDEVACRLMDNENDPASVRDLARRIKAGIATNVGEYLKCSIGVAPTRLVAKIACDMRKPDGLTIIAAQELPERLYGLALTDIPGIGARMEKRLAAKGVLSIADLIARGPRRAGDAWGAVNGDRLWWSLAGFEVPEIRTQHRSIGHSQVLSPQKRDLGAALQTARRLLLKAASRLRRGGYEAKTLALHARIEGGGKFAAQAHLPATQDSFGLLARLDSLWPRLVAAAPEGKLRMVGVTLADIAPASTDQPSLFDRDDIDHALAREARQLRLSHAMDKANARFGKNAVTLGPLSGGRSDHVGAKIAFNRIPELAEFHE
jgi:DNA polymerase-4